MKLNVEITRVTNGYIVKHTYVYDDLEPDTSITSVYSIGSDEECLLGDIKQAIRTLKKE